MKAWDDWFEESRKLRAQYKEKFDDMYPHFFSDPFSIEELCADIERCIRENDPTPAERHYDPNLIY